MTWTKIAGSVGFAFGNDWREQIDPLCAPVLHGSRLAKHKSFYFIFPFAVPSTNISAFPCLLCSNLPTRFFSGLLHVPGISIAYFDIHFALFSLLSCIACHPLHGHATAACFHRQDNCSSLQPQWDCSYRAILAQNILFCTSDSSFIQLAASRSRFDVP
jgi:hypothetical protein